MKTTRAYAQQFLLADSVAFSLILYVDLTIPLCPPTLTKVQPPIHRFPWHVDYHNQTCFFPRLPVMKQSYGIWQTLICLRYTVNFLLGPPQWACFHRPDYFKSHTTQLSSPSLALPLADPNPHLRTYITPFSFVQVNVLQTMQPKVYSSFVVLHQPSHPVCWQCRTL